MSEKKVKIADIIIGSRFRKDMGDIEGLAKSIKEQGLLQAVGITEKKELVFGYRRMKAVELLGWKNIDVRVVDTTSILEGELTENEVRKEFTVSERVAIGLALEELIGKRQGQRTDLEQPLQELAEVKKGEVTRDIAAKKAGFKSGESYRQAKRVIAEAPDLAEKVDAGKMPIYRAEQQLKRRERATTQPAMPPDKYRVIYADPPWKYNDSGLPEYGHAETHYDALTIGELCDLPIIEMAGDNAVLFLWVTSPLLEDAFKVIKAWGFSYRTSIVWDKDAHNYGHYVSVRHEFLLICVRGSCTPDTNKLLPSVVTIKRSKIHSQKPEEFREMIDTMYTQGKRIELFARNKVDGWAAWGADVNR